MDEAASTCAVGWTGKDAVAVHAGGIHLYLPIHIGHIVEVEARIIHTSERRMHMSIQIHSADAAMANASHYLEALGHLVVAWLWLEQETAAAGRTDEFANGKRAAARYFFGFELPRIATDLDILARGERLTLDLDPSVL